MSTSERHQHLRVRSLSLDVADIERLTKRRSEGRAVIRSMANEEVWLLTFAIAALRNRDDATSIGAPQRLGSLPFGTGVGCAASNPGPGEGSLDNDTPETVTADENEAVAAVSLGSSNCFNAPEKAPPALRFGLDRSAIRAHSRQRSFGAPLIEPVTRLCRPVVGPVTQPICPAAARRCLPAAVFLALQYRQALGVAAFATAASSSLAHQSLAIGRAERQRRKHGEVRIRNCLANPSVDRVDHGRPMDGR